MASCDDRVETIEGAAGTHRASCRPRGRSRTGIGETLSCASGVGAVWREPAPLRRADGRRRRQSSPSIASTPMGVFTATLSVPSADEDLGEDSLVDRLDLHGRLVGFDFGQHVAGLDLVAFFFQPFGQFALFHGGRQGGHENVDRHGRLFSSCRCGEYRRPKFARKRCYASRRMSV